MLRLGCKLWLENEQGEKAFGGGPSDLLQGVERLGSLRGAAAEMGMSYYQAWKLISLLEQRLGFKLLARQVGGKRGGGSSLTPQAGRLMQAFGDFHEEAQKNLEQIFSRHFGPEKSRGKE